MKQLNHELSNKVIFTKQQSNKETQP